MGFLDEIMGWIGVIIKHFTMIFSWLYITIIGFFEYIFGLFYIGFNYSFLNFFLGSFLLLFFGIILGIYVLSMFWENDLISKYFGKNYYMHLQKKMLNIGILVGSFLFAFIILGNSVNKMFLYTSVVYEKGIIVDLKHEGIETTDQEGFNKSLMRVATFLNTMNIKEQQIGGDSIINEGNPFIYKNIDVSDTNIMISAQRDTNGVYSIPFDGSAISIQGQPQVGSTKLYLHQIGALFQKSKDINICNPAEGQEGFQVKNVDSLGSSIIDGLTQLNQGGSAALKANVAIQKKISDINSIYANIYDKYVIGIKKDFITQDGTTIWGSDSYNRTLISKILCMNNVTKAELVQYKNPEDVQTNVLNPIFEALLTLQRFSEDSTEKIEKTENKEIFLVNAVSLLLSLSIPDSYTWRVQFQDGNTPLMDTYIVNALTTPFVISFEGGNKIVNSSMCYNFIFWPDLEAYFTSRGFGYFNNILYQSCSNNFGLIYNYKGNQIDKLGREYYKNVIEKIKQGHSQKSDKNVGEFGYVTYSNHINDFQKGTNDLFPEAKVGLFQGGADLKNYVQEFSNRLDKTNGIIAGFIYTIRDIILSFFVYLLPGLFLVFILKFIKRQ